VFTVGGHGNVASKDNGVSIGLLSKLLGVFVEPKSDDAFVFAVSLFLNGQISVRD
jgi:hypothetical protein